MASGHDLSTATRLATSRSENYSHIRMLKRLLPLVLIQFVIAGFGFLTRVQIASELGKEAFGEMAFAVAIGTYALMFIQFGFDKSLVREFVHFPNRLGELLKASLVVKLALFVSLGLLSSITIWNVPGVLGESWALYGIALATALMAFQLQPVFDAWKETRRHATYFFVERCLYFGLIWLVVLLPFLHLSLLDVGICMILSVCVGLWLQYKWAIPRIDFLPVEGLKASTGAMCRSNIWVWSAVLAGLSIDYMTQIILKYNSGNDSLGGYSAAWLIVRLALIAQSQFARIGAEKIARNTRPESDVLSRGRFLLKYTLSMTAIGGIVGLPCILFPELLLSAFGAEYSESAVMLGILGFYPIVFGPYLALVQYVISSCLEKTYFILTGLIGAISISTSLYLVPKMHGEGAAIAVIISLAMALLLFGAATLLHLKSLRRNH